MDIKELIKGGLVLFDGATGTEYQKRGLPVGTAPERWVFDKPEIVRKVHLDYINAGSRVTTTDTFGANRMRLTSHQLGDRVAEVNRTAAEIALKAAGDRAVVAGSVGPLGALLEPYGELSAAEAGDIFSEQILSILETGVDFILIETMICTGEAIAALRAAKECGAKTVGVTLTFEPSPDGPRTSFGESPEDVVIALIAEGADIVGSNCGKGFDVMREIVREMRKFATVPLLVQPNAGIPEYEEGRIVYREGPEAFAKFALEMKLLGIEFIGGCCGTTPAHIAAAKKVLF